MIGSLAGMGSVATGGSDIDGAREDSFPDAAISGRSPLWIVSVSILGELHGHNF